MKRTLVLLFAASSATAQVPLRGVAYDSLHGRPLSGAFIGIAGMNVSAVSDSAGRFTLPSVPRGTHRVVMQHDVLDALGLSAAGARAVVTDGKDSVVVAVPSFATLWRAACGPTPPGPDTGFVFGTVQRGNRPVPGAIVAASWLDLYQDTAKVIRQKQKTMELDADSLGNFAACGVPTTTGLSLRANIGSSYGVWVDLPPLDKERIARKDLTIVAFSPVRFDVPAQLAFTGRVRRDSTDAPLEGADVIVPDLGLSATTNARGEFRIPGISPGTHTVQVRKIGYAFGEQRVEFGSESVDRTLVMSRITTLDSVSVTASPYPATDVAMRNFEDHKKIGLGKFMTRADLEKVPNAKLSAVVGQWATVQLASGGPGVVWLMGNARGAKSITGNRCQPMKEDDPVAEKRPPVPCPDACYPRVFVDGVDISKTQVPNINRYISDDLEGIEYYSGGGRVPVEFNVLNARCGVLVLHTRRRR